MPDSRPFKAKYADHCANSACRGIQVGDLVVRLGEPAVHKYWYDFGKRKGETYTVRRRYQHAEGHCRTSWPPEK